MNPFTFCTEHVREASRVFVGASDIAALCGFTKRTAIDKWLVDTGKEEAWKGNDFTEIGHELEPLVLSRFIKKQYNDSKTAYKFKVNYILNEHHREPSYMPPTQFYPFTEAVHPEFDFCVAHADMLNIENEHTTEVKTGGYFARVRRDDSPGFDLDDKSENGIPADVMLQKQYQFMCYGNLSGEVVLLIDDNKLHIYEVQARPHWYPKMIEIASRYMWCVKNDRPPIPKNFGDIKKLFPEVYNRTTYVTGEKAVLCREMVEERKRHKKIIKRHQKKVDDIDDALSLMIGDNKLLFDGETMDKLCTQVLSKDQYTMIHPSTIQKECPEAFTLLNEKGLITTHDRRYIR